VLKSYVIRAGRFTDAQRKAYESLSSSFLIPFSQEPLDFDKTFGNTVSVTVEIGFGMGLATSLIAEANPDKNYLGIEVHRPGIGRLLWEIEKRSLSNIRIIEYDAISVIERMIPENSLDAVHVFFPDPWPKKRHRKRRLIQRPFTETLAKRLKPLGHFYMVTDWEDYANHALEELSACSLLKNDYDAFASPQNWRPVTKFEKRGIEESRAIKELFFRRKI
jgi:tRNA (guanine-N7-)-methyltransferase